MTITLRHAGFALLALGCLRPEAALAQGGVLSRCKPVGIETNYPCDISVAPGVVRSPGEHRRALRNHRRDQRDRTRDYWARHEDDWNRDRRRRVEQDLLDLLLDR